VPNGIRGEWVLDWPTDPRPVDQPEEVIVTAAATQSSGEDDPLSLVHHLDGTWATSAYQAIDD